MKGANLHFLKYQTIIKIDIKKKKKSHANYHLVKLILI